MTLTALLSCPLSVGSYLHCLCSLWICSEFPLWISLYKRVLLGCLIEIVLIVFFFMSVYPCLPSLSWMMRVTVCGDFPGFPGFIVVESSEDCRLISAPDCSSINMHVWQNILLTCDCEPITAGEWGWLVLTREGHLLAKVFRLMTGARDGLWVYSYIVSVGGLCSQCGWYLKFQALWEVG